MTIPNYPRAAHEVAPEPEKCDRSLTIKLSARLDGMVRERAKSKRRSVSKWVTLVLEDFFARDAIERESGGR